MQKMIHYEMLCKVQWRVLCVDILQSWSTSFWSSCWRSVVVTRSFWGPQRRWCSGSARDRVAVAAPASLEYPSHGKLNLVLIKSQFCLHDWLKPNKKSHIYINLLLQVYSIDPFRTMNHAMKELWDCTYFYEKLTPLIFFRRMLFLMKLGSLQYAIMKTVFSVFCIGLWTNGIFDPTNVCKVITQCTHTMKISCIYMRFCI